MEKTTRISYRIFLLLIWGVTTKINESQKISACYVKNVLLIKKKKQSKKGQLNPFTLLGLNLILYAFIHHS